MDKGGNALKSPGTQDKLYKQIEQKLEDYLREFPLKSLPTTPIPAQVAAQENILIQLRKLREGIQSTGRRDSFAIQVYELSYFLAIIFRSIPHMQSTSNNLPRLYQHADGLKTSNRGNSDDLRQTYTVIRLLQSLTESVPLGSKVPARKKEIDLFCQLHPTLEIWFQQLALNVFRCNFCQSMLLTDNVELKSILRILNFTPGVRERELAKYAFLSSISDLRENFRNYAWNIMRSAYRQITFPYSDDWCRRSLGLNSDDAVMKWLSDHEHANEVVAKPGSPSIWLLRKPQK